MLLMLFTNISKQNEPALCHKRLDHVSVISIKKALTKNVTVGLPSPPDVYKVICRNCEARKQIKAKCPTFSHVWPSMLYSSRSRTKLFFLPTMWGCGGIELQLLRMIIKIDVS